jgi:hypothetical protein
MAPVPAWRDCYPPCSSGFSLLTVEIESLHDRCVAEAEQEGGAVPGVDVFVVGPRGYREYVFILPLELSATDE